MIMHDKSLSGLPDDITREIFGFLDMRALKSCSLTCKALSYSAKPSVHRTLYLTPKFGRRPASSVPGFWDEFKGLPVLGERGLLQHTRHISISLSYNPFFAPNLQPHIQHLRTLTNVRSLKAVRLDTVSFLPQVERLFGAFFESLQSLELVSPIGDHKQIFHFVCRFRNLRDLKINGTQSHTNSTYNGDPCLDIKASPPLDGTLNVHLGLGTRFGGDSTDTQLFFSTLAAFPSGLKFRIIKLSGCIGGNLQLLVDACAPTLEYMILMGQWVGASFLHKCQLPWFILFDYQPAKNTLSSVSNVISRSENLKSNYPGVQTQKVPLCGYPKCSRPSPRRRLPT